MCKTESNDGVQVGDVYDVYGETVEVVNRSGDRVCLNYHDREAAGWDEEHYTAWRPIETVNDLVERESWDLVDSDREEEETETLGEWIETPRCPECGAYMSRDHDGNGLPAAQCAKVGCHGWMEDRALIDGGYVEV